MTIHYSTNDNNVWIEGLLDDITRTYVNDSTMTVSYLDQNGVPVSGATALSMSYLASSNGRYYCTIDDSVSIVDNIKYTVVIQSSNYGDRWEHPFVGRTRT